jgi:hypothetical protein
MILRLNAEKIFKMTPESHDFAAYCCARPRNTKKLPSFLKTAKRECMIVVGDLLSFLNGQITIWGFVEILLQDLDVWSDVMGLYGSYKLAYECNVKVLSNVMALSKVDLNENLECLRLQALAQASTFFLIFPLLIAMNFFSYYYCLNKRQGKRFEEDANLNQKNRVARYFHYFSTFLSVERISKYFFPDQILNTRRLEIEGCGVLFQSFPQTIIYASIIAQSKGNAEVITSLVVSVLRLLYFVV